MQTTPIGYLPGLSDTPAISSLGSPAASGGMQALSIGFNALLDAELANLRASSGANIIGLDIFSLGKQVVANPGAFGLTNATDAHLAAPVGDPNLYAYWDDVHPTEPVHALFASAAADALAVPEPSTALFLSLGISALLIRCRAR